MKITFEQPMPAGFEITFGGQLYRSLGSAEYHSKSGRVVSANAWATNCAECGKSFTAWSTPKAALYLSRRCSEHAKPGVVAKSPQLSNAMIVETV